MLCQQQTVHCVFLNFMLVSYIVPGAFCGWSPQVHTALQQCPRHMYNKLRILYATAS